MTRSTLRARCGRNRPIPIRLRQLRGRKKGPPRRRPDPPAAKLRPDQANQKPESEPERRVVGRSKAAQAKAPVAEKLWGTDASTSKDAGAAAADTAALAQGDGD